MTASPELSQSSTPLCLLAPRHPPHALTSLATLFPPSVGASRWSHFSKEESRLTSPTLHIVKQTGLPASQVGLVTFSSLLRLVSQKKHSSFPRHLLRLPKQTQSMIKKLKKSSWMQLLTQPDCQRAAKQNGFPRSGPRDHFVPDLFPLGWRRVEKLTPTSWRIHLSGLTAWRQPARHLFSNFVRQINHSNVVNHRFPRSFDVCRIVMQLAVSLVSMEMRGFEPLTPWLQTRCSPS